MSRSCLTPSRLGGGCSRPPLLAWAGSARLRSNAGPALLRRLPQVTYHYLQAIFQHLHLLKGGGTGAGDGAVRRVGWARGRRGRACAVLVRLEASGYVKSFPQGFYDAEQS
jgi:hypothetical protein